MPHRIVVRGRILVSYNVNIFCGVRKQHAKLAMCHTLVVMTTATSVSISSTFGWWLASAFGALPPPTLLCDKINA